jgi:phosphate transport system substrate-binding protein
MSAYAQSAVVLTSKDGSVSITGELLAFEDGFFNIRTSLGTMRIDGSRMNCDGDACPKTEIAAGDIVIAGSDTIGVGLMPLLATGYAGSLGGDADIQNGEQENVVVASLLADSGFGDPIGNFVINSSGSDDAFRALSDGSTQIGMSSRRIRPAEARRIRDSGGGNMIDPSQEHVVAVDSLVVITHPSNPIQNLTLDQLDLIYSGNVTNWAELGGPNAPIVAYGRESGSGAEVTFEERIFSTSGRTRSDVVRVSTSDEAMATAVASDPNAIGYVGYAYQRGTKAMNLTGECGLTAVPDAFSAKTEEYPLQRRLYLYNRSDNMTEITKNFLDFVTSDAADGVIAKSGFIDLSVERKTQTSDDRGRMRNLIEATIDPFEFGLMRDLLVDMFNWDRLSTTFRFASGSSALDAKGEFDLDRLIKYLEEAPEGTRVAFVGFTDSDGAFEANRALSIGRAQQVVQAAEQAAAGRLRGVQFEAKGYGELSPAACNTTLEGKRINRRVEVWITAPQA